MPLFNWWYNNPYRKVSDSVEYPVGIKRFVIYNNERTPILDKLIAQVAKNPIYHEKKMRGIRDNCLHRAKIFRGFPASQKEKLDITWKTMYLRSQAIECNENWSVILKCIDARIRSMEYKMPQSF